MLNAAYIGVAASSNCVMGGSPRISSIVRTIDEVVYMVLSTTPRFIQGEITRPTVRCASTWSGPFCASSSITKIAVSFQNREWLTASTILPSA